MAASLNQVTLIGNLTADPEPKFLQNGTCVANLRLAINRKYKGSNGESKEEVTYVNVETWGKCAEACAEYLKKGSPALVEGRLKFKEWEKDGVKRTALEVVAERVQFLSGGKGKPEGIPESENPF